MSEISLEKKVVVFWCNYYSNFDEKFSWISEIFDRFDLLKEGISLDSELQLLVALQQSSRNEQSEGFVAAGPLEDLVEMVLLNRRIDLAKFIVRERPLYEMVCDCVWPYGLHKYLKKIAASNDVIEAPSIEVKYNLKKLSIEQVVSFWLAKLMPGNENFYERVEEEKNKVIELMRDPETREVVVDDLISGKPYSKAEILVEEIIKDFA